jgi:hypothetical protein
MLFSEMHTIIVIAASWASPCTIFMGAKTLGRGGFSEKWLKIFDVNLAKFVSCKFNVVSMRVCFVFDRMRVEGP